jgi:hypothetical protein
VDIGWQNSHNKGVTAKFVQSNELAPALGRGSVFSIHCFKYSWVEITNTPSGSLCDSLVYVVSGLDMGFLGGKWEKKICGAENGIGMKGLRS